MLHLAFSAPLQHWSEAVPTPHGQTLALFFYAGGAAFLWAFCLSGLVLLARDARSLGIPGVVRNTILSAVIYALLTIAIPALVAGVFGWDSRIAALMSALAVAGGLGFVLLPRWASAWFGFVPAIYGSAHATFHPLSPLDPRFPLWSVPALLVLGVAAVIQWRKLLLNASSDAAGWRNPMILQMHQQAVSKCWGFDKQLLWQRSDKQHLYMTLHAIDARTPVKTIEVALGIVYVPRSMIGKLRAFATVAWPLALVAVLLIVLNLAHMHVWGKTLAVMGASGLMGGGMVLLVMAALLVFTTLQRRWSEGAEPALLALLPGLDQHAPIMNSVVCAAFRKPIMLFVVLWLVLVASVLLLHAGIASVVLITLFVLTVFMATAVHVLRLFAARPMRALHQALIAIFTLVLLCASLPVSMAMPRVARHWPPGILIEWGLDIAWVIFGAWMTYLAMRAWHVLQRRPHPFMASN